jgi:hypothetical protein
VRTTSQGADRCEAAVILTWVGGRVERHECSRADARNLDWVYALAASDARLLKATVIEEVPLMGDDEFGGPVTFVTNIVCFRGSCAYPTFWYQEISQYKTSDEAAVPPAKKARKK